MRILIQKHVTRFLLLVQLLRPPQALQCRVLYTCLMHHGSYSACSGRKAFLSAFVALVARTRSSIPKDTRQLLVQRAALRSRRSVRESQARRGPNFPGHHPWKSMTVLSDSKEESTHPPAPLNNTIMMTLVTAMENVKVSSKDECPIMEEVLVPSQERSVEEERRRRGVIFLFRLKTFFRSSSPSCAAVPWADCCSRP